MQFTIKSPQQINTTINLPASKSISNRALIIHALSKGKSTPRNLSNCDDTTVIKDALRDNPYEINIKASGTAMRFLTAYLAATNSGEHILTGTRRMQNRPIGYLVESLRYLGADITYLGEEGFPPLLIKGKTLGGGRLEMRGDISSQYISALLMIAPALRDGLKLKLTEGIVSRPYIDLTLNIMSHYGADAQWSDVDTITVKPKPYSDADYFIENDWTSSSYWYEMLALSNDNSSELRLTGLFDNSQQGDSVVRYIFSLLGIKTSFENKIEDNVPATVVLSKNKRNVSHLEYNFTNSPDLAQTVITSCAALDIPFRFTGLSSLRIKETDRIEAIKKELLKLGYVLDNDNDGELSWNGKRCKPTSNVIDTYEDHRMAMSFAPLSAISQSIRINSPSVVTKSYTHFWEDLKKAGYIIEENQ